MRITHLCLACFFPDGYSYQENMLPKYHKKLGHDVSVIASLQTFDKNGKVTAQNPAPPSGITSLTGGDKIPVDTEITLTVGQFPGV